MSKMPSRADAGSAASEARTVPRCQVGLPVALTFSAPQMPNEVGTMTAIPLHASMSADLPLPSTRAAWVLPCVPPSRPATPTGPPARRPRVLAASACSWPPPVGLVAVLAGLVLRPSGRVEVTAGL
ncbi:hypothetical protein C1I97_28355 [Streptomyces sp. NTH33]|uniref:hypothetical protein n=1 Tax=Streptomyces sp. NTH33 TaxID=1735453 RepID=UPI000DAA3100|nr:hypothetical protein [Streptomyces sp. NTH33]PZG93662.1 hypothetical protein C1I97_28355 [Streptomyces sp. NTH33]